MYLISDDGALKATLPCASLPGSLTGFKVELGLEARARPRPRVEEEDEPGSGGLDPGGQLLAAELKVVVVVLVLLLLPADVHLQQDGQKIGGVDLCLSLSDVGPNLISLRDKSAKERPFQMDP